MRCAAYSDLLQSYVDDDLEAGRRQSMHEHGRRCYPCREALGETQALFRLLDCMEREPAPPGIVEAVLRCLPRVADLEAAQHPPRLHQSRRRSLVMRLVGGMVVLLLLGAGFVSSSPWGSPLGTLATWWYVWVGDLARSLTWLRAASVAEMEQAAAALWRAALLVLRAGAAQLLFFWTLATLAGLCLSARQRAAAQVPRVS